jgi:hypothetical protein
MIVNSTTRPPEALAPALRFSVLGWSAWSPDRETRSAWRRWAGAPETAGEDEPPTTLPPMLRRRLGKFGQKLVGVASDCAAGLPAGRYVLSTRHGEFNRALATLDAIESDGLPSPTDFSMSIHHALLGLLSIHAGNRLGHTALSAGWDSFANGLLEAAACIAEQPREPVVLIHADEPLPGDYAVFGQADEAALPLAMAVCLGSPGSSATDDDILLTVGPAPADVPASPSMALDFLRFVLSGGPSARSVGRRLQWVCRRGL